MTMNAIVNAGLIPEWSISDRLRKARETAGLEQQQLAEATGLSRQTVSSYERGTVTPRRSGLNLWAMATGVPLIWITTGCTPPDLNREPTGYGSLRAIESGREARILQLTA